jgi:glycosyltransferase involved in cell wall biosynthesis
MRPSVIILTFNSEATLPQTLASIRDVSDDVYIVDSFSTDRTLEVARPFGAQVFQHPFESYGAQRNWAIDNMPVRYGWQLHLDADERLTPELAREIVALEESAEAGGYLLPRMLKFLGRILKHGGMSPTWHLRLFRNGYGRCEDRKYDQHFYLLQGKSVALKGQMIDDVRMTLSEWTARHNRWADAEVDQILAGAKGESVRPDLLGNAIEKRRYYRKLYTAAPLFVRPFLLFFYRFFFRLGFLDGVPGLVFWVLQTFWFRFLVDAKIWERRHVLGTAPSD